MKPFFLPLLFDKRYAMRNMFADHHISPFNCFFKFMDFFNEQYYGRFQTV